MSDMSFQEFLNQLQAQQYQRRIEQFNQRRTNLINRALPDEIQSALNTYQQSPNSLSARQGVFTALYKDDPKFTAGLAGQYNDYDSLFGKVSDNYVSKSPLIGELLKGLDKAQQQYTQQQSANILPSSLMRNGAGGLLSILMPTDT